MRWTVECLTRARARLERATPAERRLAGGLALAWAAGVALGWTGWDAVPARFAEARLHPPLPTVAELAERLPPGDPRPGWYAAGLALRAERARADSGPTRIDPNRADRADWDRLPRIGPRTAEAILAVRGSRGPFRSPEDLLAVRGIGPKTLEKIRPWLDWGPAGTPATSTASRGWKGGGGDLNRVGVEELAALPGIGPHLARKIERERRRLGGFRTWADVLAVDGIGPSRLRVLQNAMRLADWRAPSATDDGTPDEGTS